MVEWDPERRRRRRSTLAGPADKEDAPATVCLASLRYGCAGMLKWREVHKSDIGKQEQLDEA
ncbi:unnamed protein product [Gongylonema pulchrum]|uniref:Uncharacterized protein n=1 Tax=Gongylonema pulchrum TaxID=637853 RepID=A0A183DCX1_9BILA|nr:unnamed protein product [Gongylonema pulchrum]